MTQLYPHTTAARTRHANASAAKRLRSNVLRGFDSRIVTQRGPKFKPSHLNASMLNRRYLARPCPVFACTPDQFPSMTVFALTGKDLRSWAAEEDIALIRGILSANSEIVSG